MLRGRWWLAAQRRCGNVHVQVVERLSQGSGSDEGRPGRPAGDNIEPQEGKHWRLTDRQPERQMQWIKEDNSIGCDEQQERPESRDRGRPRREKKLLNAKCGFVSCVSLSSEDANR